MAHTYERPTVKVRASSLAELFDCAHRWEAKHIKGMRDVSGIRAHLGTSIHAGTAAFDLGRMPDGFAIDADQACGIFFETLHNPDREIDYGKDDMTVKEAANIGLSLVQQYCDYIAPTMNFIAVEAKLKPIKIDCGGGVVIELTGSLDRTRIDETDGGDIIDDIKTGAAVIAKGEAKVQGRSSQLGIYQVLWERSTSRPTAGARIIAGQTTKTGGWAVSETWDAKSKVVGTDDSPGLLEHAAAIFRAGTFPPNPTSPMCNERYCVRWSTCPYHE